MRNDEETVDFPFLHQFVGFDVAVYLVVEVHFHRTVEGAYQFARSRGIVKVDNRSRDVVRQAVFHQSEQKEGHEQRDDYHREDV